MRSAGERIPAAILGATGVVGQRLVAALATHPWLRLGELVASDRSAGHSYAESARWLLPQEPPQEALGAKLLPPGAALDAPIVFSALGREAALELEPLYRDRGHAVVSNASAFRADPAIPLVVPEVNPEALVEAAERPGGLLVTNPNCCVAGLVLALAPLERAFGIEAVTVATLQALSGAGLPGHPALEAIGNVIPTIPGEEEKIRREPLKILRAVFPISVAVHRVPVADGHTLTVFVRLRRRAGLDAIRQALADFRGAPPSADLPSAPERPLRLLDDAARPQPRLDADHADGMVVTVGPLTADPVYDVRFTLVVHNTRRGAAGAALLNAELLVAVR